MNTQRPQIVAGADIAAARGTRTQTEIAALLGVSRATVQNWEAERCPITPVAWLALQQWQVITKLKADLKALNPEKYADL
jgi:DNA-binding transcriptional regulator YiaG